MKNITVSISDQAYKEARAWAAANCTSVSAAVEAYIEILTATKANPENLERINLIRQKARARDREAAHNQADTPKQESPARLPKSFGVLSVLRQLLKNNTETVR